MKHFRLYLVFAFFLLLNTAFWFYARDMKPFWEDVPPVPQQKHAAFSTLGDEQMAFRMAGIMLQNFGDTYGRSTALKDYNYDRLGKWLFFADKLDQRSNYLPFLAAYYYGASQDPSKIDPVIDYLKTAGQRPDGEKWRWLLQATYLARFRQDNLEKALALAELLAEHPNEDRPLWSYQMPVFVMQEMGNKEAAYNLVINLLRDEAENLHPAEVNFMLYHLCDRILTPEQKAEHPLCQQEY